MFMDHVKHFQNIVEYKIIELYLYRLVQPVENRPGPVRKCVKPLLGDIDLPRPADILADTYRAKRNNQDQNNITHVFYNELIDNTLEVLVRIYNDGGEHISAELRAIFEKSNKENPKGKYGVHKYDLSDFGIDRSYVNRFVKGYLDFSETIKKN